MLTGTHRFPKQDQIVYGRPAAEVVRELARDFQAIAEHTMHDGGVRYSPRAISGPAGIVEILELAAG